MFARTRVAVLFVEEFAHTHKHINLHQADAFGLILNVKIGLESLCDNYVSAEFGGNDQWLIVIVTLEKTPTTNMTR